MAILVNSITELNLGSSMNNLLTVSDTNLRNTAYHGFLDGLVSKLLENTGNLYEIMVTLELDQKIDKLSSLILNVGDYCLVDLNVMENLFVNKLKYFISRRYVTDAVYASSTLLKALGVEDIYSIKDIEMIDNNFTIYKDGYTLGSKYYFNVFSEMIEKYREQEPVIESTEG